MKINKIYRLFTLVFFTILCFCGSVTAQSSGDEVSATIVDEQGNPLSGVGIYGTKGTEVSTNENGVFKITLSGDNTIVIKKKGYESVLINASNMSSTIELKKSLFLDSDDDDIMMGVSTKSQRNIVGAVSSVRPEDRLTYDNTQFILNYVNGLTVGVRGGSNIRGLGGALFVIDGVFGRNPNILNMEEVEQITVLKDANAVALYGSQARDGVIIINTKRGKINERKINVNVRSGISTPISLPNYLDAATFMEFRNEAFMNDGQDPNQVGFSAEQIQSTRSGLNPIQNPDVDLYDFVSPFTTTTSVISDFTGGNEKSQYYVNLGWNYNDNWVDISDNINAANNRFNVRGNIDFKVNDWITSSLDGVFIIQSDRGPRSNILNAATSFIPFDYAPLIPVSSIDTQNNPVLAELLAGANVFDGNILGTVQQGGDNPIATAIAGGYRDNVFRGTQFNNSVNFDLSAITEGLSAKTYLSFDFADSYTVSVQNDIRLYAPTGFDGNRVTSLQDFGMDQRSLSENVSSNGFVSRLGLYGLFNYEKSFKNHSINTTLLGYYNSQQSTNAIQTDKDAHIGFQMTYDYKKKLYVDFSGSYVNSIKLPSGNRGALSPTVGLAYILSEEEFFKKIDFVNYLKFRATGGIIKSDISLGYFLFDENYASGSNFFWADGAQSNRVQNISQGANPNLGYEERVDLNIGFETLLMNSLWLEANYFRIERENQLTVLADQYPSYYSDFRPNENFDADLTTGFEIGLNYYKTYNDFTIGIGANVLYDETIASKRSETNEFDFQNRQGRETSTIFGLEDLGFYSESDFSLDGEGNFVLNADLPVPNFGSVQPGDIRYADQNNDNVIDQDDRIGIGQGRSPLTYGININLKYKGFSFFALGTGQTSGLGNKLNGNFRNYYAPNGNDKYSEVVLNRWTPATASTATFPRLSAQNNQNNFRPSSFWLYDNSFFRISRAQLTYEFTDTLCDKIGVKDFSLNLQGTNLFEVAENKDIRQLNIGRDPLPRTYTVGVRASF